MKWFLVSIVVCCTVFADLLQSREMKLAGEQCPSARGLVHILKMIASRTYLGIAIFFMAISFFAFMALLQREPMSFAVPASAAQVVLEVALAKLLLHEYVGPRRIVGAALVLGGVILLAQ
jgi:drug/metabolite transporter (DMT)-like permease